MCPGLGTKGCAVQACSNCAEPCRTLHGLHLLQTLCYSSTCGYLLVLRLLVCHVHDAWQHLLYLCCQVRACGCGQQLLVLVCSCAGPTHELLHHVTDKQQLIIGKLSSFNRQ
jgi:hypothetical protein